MMDWLGRLDIVALALLLAYAVSNAVRVSYACRTAPRSPDATRNILNADINRKLRSLDSISFVSPYLGLAGTCFGIMNAFIAFGMEKQTALALTASRVVAALVTTAAGIVVALVAECLSHYLRSFPKLLVEVSRSKFPLRRRFSEFPAFALIAAPALGLSIGAFMTFSSLHEPTGLNVGLAATCVFRSDERIVVLHIADDGTIFINFEREDWKGLANRLSQIYSIRSNRILYLSAENGPVSDCCRCDRCCNECQSHGDE